MTSQKHNMQHAIRTETLSSVFNEIHELDRSFQRVAGHQSMDDHQARDLLKMLRACRNACDETLASLPPAVPAEAPTVATITHAEALFMDETAGLPFHLETKAT